MKEPYECNFIQEMRRKLQLHQLEKLRRQQQKHKKSQFFVQQSQAKDALMGCEESQVFEQVNQQTQPLEHLTGWTSTRGEEDNNTISERRSYSLRKNSRSQGPFMETRISERRNKNIGLSTELKDLLKRLQSPKVHQRRGITAQSARKIEEVNKIKYAQKAYPKLSLAFNKTQCNQKAQIVIKSQRKCIDLQSKQLKKYNTIDINSENNPYALTSGRVSCQYQRIKRKTSQCQNELDIAMERNILQQLIKGSNKKGLCLNKNVDNLPKFTLKNLLC